MFRRVMGFCVVLLALTTAASAAPTIELNHVGGDPVIVNAPEGYNRAHPAGLTMRRTTGTLYWGQTWNGGVEMHKIDSSVTKLLSESYSTTNDAGMGVIQSYRSKYYTGSVQSGTATNAVNTTSPAWNPTSDTIMTKRDSWSWWGVQDSIAQTAAEGVGVVNEGASQGGTKVTTGAYAAQTTNSTLFGHVGGGMAWVDHVNIGGTNYDRAFYSHQKYGTNDPARWIRVIWMTDTVNGWDATNVGSRTTLQLHNNSLADSLLLDETAYGALVDVATDEYITDLAVYDDQLFILSRSNSQGDTYLSAVLYDLPTDGATAVSVTGVVDLDPNSDKNYLVLDDLLSAAGAPNPDINGGGLDFGAGTGDTILYVASTQGFTYTFKVESGGGASGAVPEPAGLAFLGLAALAVRKRRK